MVARQEPTVFVVDDSGAGRHSLKMLVETVGLAVRDYALPRDFLSEFDPGVPGCIVLDVRMPGMSGIDVLEEIRRRGSRMPVIVMTAYGDVPTAVQAFKRGAVDFIEKPFSDQVMLAQIQKCVNDDLARFGSEHKAEHIRRSIEILSDREREVLKLIAEGNSSKRIADTLNISPRTVENHRARIKEKLGASSLAELVIMVQAAKGTPSA